MTTDRDYVLGTHDAEIERLGLQHRVWRPEAMTAWRHAGFARGQTLIDVGCGPGYATLDLAGIVGPSGRVVALDRSRRFLDVLGAAALAGGLANLDARELDFDLQPFAELSADGAWSRWVYAFVREPRRLLEGVAAALRPGGVMALHEYVDYRAWRLSPRDAVFEGFVDEVMSSWRDDGGEPDIGLDLPRWLEALGFELRNVRPIAGLARPGDDLWRWPKAFVEVGARRLAELGRVDEARAEGIVRALAEVERTLGAFMTTPTVIEIVAVRS